MFKIHDDKVYFVAETPDINKVIEIFLPKDDRGTIMDSHEIRVDLCRAVIHMEKKGVRVLKVRNIEDTNKASIDIWHMPEYQEAAESPVSDVVNACIESCFDSGAMFNLPCKANRKTHEVFAVECCARPDKELFNGRISRNHKKDSEDLHKYRSKKVSKGRRSIRRQRYAIQPYDTVRLESKTYITSGCHNKGTRLLIPANGKSKSVAISKVQVVCHAGAWIQII